MKRVVENHYLRQIGLLFLIMIPIYFFWYSPVFYPLRLLTVFFHEASHAIAAVATGGEVTNFRVSPNASGLISRRGGNDLIIGNAGYMGACVWGSVIYLFGARTHWDKWVLGGLGVLLVSIALYFPSEAYAMGFAIISGVSLIGIAYFTNQKICDFLLRIIGMTSMLNAFYAIFYGMFLRGARSEEGLNDAINLSERVGGSPRFWATCWVVFAVVVIGFTLSSSIKKSKRRTLNKSP